MTAPHTVSTRPARENSPSGNTASKSPPLDGMIGFGGSGVRSRPAGMRVAVGVMLGEFVSVGAGVSVSVGASVGVSVSGMGSGLITVGG